MPTNRRILSQDAAVSAGDANAAQGLVLHLDANDEDSIESGGANQGNGSGTWFDIANHDLVKPLVDKASNLILNLDGGISAVIPFTLSGRINSPLFDISLSNFFILFK